MSAINDDADADADHGMTAVMHTMVMTTIILRNERYTASARLANANHLH